MDLRVESLWRYPVKSLGGEQLTSADVVDTGIVGDRSFGLRDVETGLILTARRQPELLFASAQWHDGSVRVTLPDGSITDSDADLSSWLGKPVELVSGAQGGGRYENPMDVENDADWVEWDGPPDSFHDSGRTRASLVSTATLRDWDPIRFRKNIICAGSGEDDLIGAAVQIGSAEFDVTKRVGRCVMVTRPQPGVDRDLDVLKTINRERNSELGIGMTVTTHGTINVGDAVMTT
ncbi:MAG: MOSC domain-containing protein [Acidimicrobiia bacterium]